MQPQRALVFYPEAQLQRTVAALRAEVPQAKTALAGLRAEAEAALARPLDPVTNKTILPPSGDRHDYLSIGVYWWPDPASPTGLPWIRRDGFVNPATSGRDTDRSRLTDLLGDLRDLAFAHYFTGDIACLERARTLLQVWFVDEKTRVNPHLNFAQGVPGAESGRSYGIIEWAEIGHLLTAWQLVQRAGRADATMRAAVDGWLRDYYTWLRTSAPGQEAEATPNNHGTWYDVQVMGLAIYLGLPAAAHAQAEAAKIRRIDAQIAADGSQPHELDRTRSATYTALNLWGFVCLAGLGRQVGVDLWNHQGAAGQGLAAAFDFLRPYALGTKRWSWPQVAVADVDRAVQDLCRALFLRSGSMLGVDLVGDPGVRAAWREQQPFREALLYPDW